MDSAKQLAQHLINAVQGQESPRPDVSSTEAMAAVGLLSLDLERLRGSLQVAEAAYRMARQLADELGRAPSDPLPQPN